MLPLQLGNQGERLFVFFELASRFGVRLLLCNLRLLLGNLVFLEGLLQLLSVRPLTHCRQVLCTQHFEVLLLLENAPRPETRADRIGILGKSRKPRQRWVGCLSCGTTTPSAANVLMTRGGPVG
jgi:hypothetical protein